MDFSLSSLPLLGPLNVGVPQINLFFLINFSCFLGVLFFSIWRFISNNFIAARLSFCVASLICVFYQLPLTIFSHQVETSLQNPWVYAYVVNGSAGFLLLYSGLTKSLDLRLTEQATPQGLLKIYPLTLLAAVLSLSIYLIGVPWPCTGLYALLFDPWLTLLAREFGVKLVGTSLVTYFWGAYANAIAPILVLTSIWLIKTSRGPWRAAGIFLGLVTGFVAIGAVLISGTKGLLIPLLIMLLAGAYFWSHTWLARIVAIVLSVAFVLVSLIGFELFKERSSIVGAEYDFAACSVRSGTCNRSLEMLDSMRHRDGSLGIPAKFIGPIQDRLVCLCNRAGEEIACPDSNLGVLAAGSFMEDGASERFGRISERSVTYVEAIFNRMFVVPFQVSTWSFMYAETEFYDGLKTLPFAVRFFGESLNFPQLVYQKYGSVYSRGDRTSTSTAPTGFFLSYPANLGVNGFFLAMICILVLDILLSRLAVLAGSSLAPLLVGVVVILSVNFMTSDFVTVLLSHGGGAGIVLLGIYALLGRNWK